MAILSGDPAYAAGAGLKGGGNMAELHLAQAIGGDPLMGLIAAVAFATILAVVSGITLTAAATVSHDLYGRVFGKGAVTEKQEVRVARLAAFIIGAVAIALSIPAHKLNIAFLVALAFAVAASANLPALL